MSDMEQWDQQQRLAETYREKWDDELLALAVDYADLTPSAQEALRAEMLRRGLGDPLTPQPRPAEPAEPGSQPETELTWKTPLCNCEDSEQARLLTEVLRRAGIESWIEGGGRYSWDINGPRMLVAADQLEQAREVIARPVPQEVLDQVRAELADPEPYVPPVCPACGAPDPLLVGVEPSNSWECEACGRAWEEPAPPATEI